MPQFPTDMPERDEAEAASLAPSPPLALPARGLGVWGSGLTARDVSVAAVMALAWPAIGEQVLNAIIGLTDTVIAGHLPGSPQTVAAATAAVGLMTYIQWFAGLMTAALGVGATAIVARSIGAGRPNLARRVTGTSVTAAFAIGLATAIMLFVFARPVVYACRLHGQAALFAIQYLSIMVVTISLQTAAQIGMAALRGAGNTFQPMMIMLMVMVINGIFSTAFTYGWLGAPAWGLRGDAFGTLLAYLTGGICTTIILFANTGKLTIRLRHLRLVPHLLTRVVKVGFPSFVEGILLWAGQFLIVLFVMNAATDPNGYTLAAHVSVLRIESIAFLPGFGFGIAASTMVGQYLGAGRLDQARLAGKLATLLGLGTMTALALPMVFAPRFMLGLIVTSQPVINTGLWPMVLAGLAQPGFALAICFSGALKGAGETFWPMVVTLGGIFIARFGTLGVLWPMWHEGLPAASLTAVWIGILVDLSLRGLLNYGAFYRVAWHKRRV